MKYKAITFYDQHLKHIENGGHVEEFETDYQIKKGDGFVFNKIYGFFNVSSVTINIKLNIIELLISPDVYYR